MNHEPPGPPRYKMNPKAIAIAKEYWAHVTRANAIPEDRERGFSVLMAQMQIDLILCHLNDMSIEDAERAQRTLEKLYLKL